MLEKYVYFCKTKLRGGAVAARWAHNPKVVGSNPAPATKQDFSDIFSGKSFFCFPVPFVISLVHLKIELLNL